MGSALHSVLVDTNVWVDIVLKRPQFYEDSLGCVMACIMEDVELLVVGTSLKDVFYWADKSAGTQAAYNAVELLLGIAGVATVDEPICRHAQQLERPDYEDGIVAACARAEGVDAIVTRDATAFASAGVGKYAPHELIEALGYEDIEL